jgi:glycerol kinase
VTLHILAIDQGTTGSTALVMDTHGHTLGRANRELPAALSKPGWVEHEPEEDLAERRGFGARSAAKRRSR